MTREHSANKSMDTKTDTTIANQGAAVLVGSGPSFVSAAVRRYSHNTGRNYYACLHDPTAMNPKPCSFFEALPSDHPFAGFCRYNMSRQDSRLPEDFGDLCYSRRAVEALREPNAEVSHD